MLGRHGRPLFGRYSGPMPRKANFVDPLLALSLLVGAVSSGLAASALTSGQVMVQLTYLATRADDPKFYWIGVAARAGGAVISFAKAGALLAAARGLAPA